MIVGVLGKQMKYSQVNKTRGKQTKVKRESGGSIIYNGHGDKRS